MGQGQLTPLKRTDLKLPGRKLHRDSDIGQGHLMRGRGRGRGNRMDKGWGRDRGIP